MSSEPHARRPRLAAWAQAGFFFALAPIAARAAEQVVARTLTVPAACAIRIETYHGPINVREGPPGQVGCTVTIQAFGETAEAHAILRTVRVDIGEDRGGAHVVVRNPSVTGVRWVWEDLPPPTVTCAVTVPPHARLDILNQDGGATVGNVSGSVQVSSVHGIVFLRHVDGDVECTSDRGEIVISRCGGSARLTSRGGDIRTGAILGHAEITTHSGDIEVQRAEGGIDAHTDSGSITVGFAGAVLPSRLSTQFGDIVVTLDPALHCTLRAASVWGRVHVGVPLALRAGSDGSRSVEGWFNGGGPAITLRANGGQVRILPSRA